MKAFTFFLFVSLFSLTAANANFQDSKVSIKKNNATIEEILNEIESQTNLLFIYTDEVDVEATTSIDADNKPVKEVLTTILGDSVSFQQEGNHIVISKEGTVSSETVQQDNTIRVTGVVTDSRGETLPGAVIIAKNESNNVTTTDLDGKYAIAINEGAQLEFSYIGYKTQIINPNGKAVLNVTLKEDSELLEATVVVGYGTQRKSDITGAVSHVNMEEIIGDRPIASLAQALQSAVPGLQISQNSGRVGSGMNVNIRGVTSVNNSDAQPLVLVDNVPMDIEMLDPNDIKSVTVLKDASSSAIYGARAAYGIILIETKQGARDMPLTLNYSNNFTFSSVASLPQVMGPTRTVEYYDDLGIVNFWGGENVPTWLGLLDEYNNKGLHQEGYTSVNGKRYGLAQNDVYSEMMDDFGFQHRHNVSMSGGGERANYRASFGAVDEDGVLRTNQDSYSRYTATAFMNMDITKWLSGQVDMSYSQSNTSQPKANYQNGKSLWEMAYQYQPMAPTGYGYTDRDTEKTDLLPYFSPSNMLELDNPIKTRKSNTRVLGRLIISPIEGLEIIGEYSYYRKWGSRSYSPMYYRGINPVQNEEKTSVNTTFYEMQNWFSENNSLNAYATYDKSFNDAHNLKVMVGYNMESYNYENLYGKRDDLIDPNLPSLSLASGIQETKDGFAQYSLMSGFYRINYDYKSRYLITLNGRYDGSSRFAEGNKFGFFPSISGGWNIAKEPFMKSINKTVSNLKLRASWGSIGNQNVSNYGYLGIMDPNLTNWVLPGGDQKEVTLGRPSLVSSMYTWESVETLDIGLDIGLMEDRLQVVFDWYQRTTNNMLAPASTAPSVLGTTFPQTNSASLKTNGWELSLQWKDTIGDFHYYIGGNIYDSKSIITKYDNAQGILLGSGTNANKLILREGMEFGEIWGYTHDRLYTTGDFDASGKLLEGIPRVDGVTKPNPGDVLYVDHNGDGIINNGTNTEDDSGDLVRIGNNSARYQYGINGGFSYKGFSLSFLFSGVGKRDLRMPNYYPGTGTFLHNLYGWQEDYWTEDNLNSYWPRLYGEGGNNGANNETQDKYILNGSYFKLQNLTLGYTFPRSFCEKISLKEFRVFVTGENLFTIHHLPKGYYPENFISQPGSLKMISGLQGGDGHGNWAYPQMMQFSFGFNITF